MRIRVIYLYFILFLVTGCVDRLFYEIESITSQGISISGYISDLPGPYEIRIYSVFDIDSEDARRTPVTVKKITLSDNAGNAESLTEISAGYYQTQPDGIRGVAGRAYKINIELFDGRIYESIPDTIIEGGTLDSMYLEFRKDYNEVGTLDYSVDVFFDASLDSKVGNRFLWQFTGTYKAETQPEYYVEKECFWLDEIGRCNFVPPCSGYINISSIPASPEFVKKYECTCCICWYQLFNDYPILSDNLFISGGQLKKVRAHNVPLNQWTLSNKIHIELNQMSLTQNTFRFWKAVENQRTAVNSLFQPISGRIPKNFIQTSGKSVPIEGIFFATSIHRKETYLKQFDLPPNFVYSISLEKPIFGNDCIKMTANASYVAPLRWKE